MMIKGFLKIMVLESLKESPKTGYELMKFIEEKNGKKPSSGSIYPLMKELNEKGFIKPKLVERKKIYSMTPKGKKRIQEIEKERQVLKQKHEKLHKIVDELSGKKPEKPMDFDSKYLMRNMDIIHEFKDAVQEIMESKNFFQNEAEMRRIIKDASTKLKHLK